MPARPDKSNVHTPEQRLEEMQGVVERLTYHSSESGYSVARFKVPGNQDLVTIVGSTLR